MASAGVTGVILPCSKCLSFFSRLAQAEVQVSKRKPVGPQCPSLRMAHHPSHLVILANVNRVGWGMFSAFYERNSKVHNDLEELKEGGISASI